MTRLPDRNVPIETIVDVLRWRGANQPDRIGYCFLRDSRNSELQFSYGQLDREARSIARQIRKTSTLGDRALLLYTPGLEYISAFFGCLYAGVVAVPAPALRLLRIAPGLDALSADCNPSVLLTTQAGETALKSQAAGFASLERVPIVTTDTGHTEGSDYAGACITSGSLAFLQYTSGATGTPKGVMLSHANLLDNLGHIHRSFRHTPDSRGVIWLPPYHDMGLIGGILQPLYGGFPVTLMSPLSFMQRPYRWLETISRTGATSSGGPDFAYRLAAERITGEERASLDLRSWEVAFCGAEMVRPDTIERFTGAFAPCGFRREAFYPCYGLAESTLIVSGPDKRQSPVLQRVPANGVSAPPKPSPSERQVVSCGRAVAGDGSLVIVDPDTCAELPKGEIGEIWTKSASVADGYWNRPAESAGIFHAFLNGSGMGPYLRTGDRGFLVDGELFVVGRIKDLIVIAGRKHHPEDIETTTRESADVLGAGGTAAFSVELEGEERLVIIHEVHRHVPPESYPFLQAGIQTAVTERHGIRPHEIMFTRQMSLPRTTSGKIRRGQCQTEYAAGEFHRINEVMAEA